MPYLTESEYSRLVKQARAGEEAEDRYNKQIAELGAMLTEMRNTIQNLKKIIEGGK